MKKTERIACRQSRSDLVGVMNFRRLVFCRGMIALLASAILAGGLRLEAADPHKATTSRKARNEAIGAIPFDKLNEAARAKISKVVSKPSLYRRMPVEVIDCDPDLYLFLVRYPEVLINVWRLMGVTNVAIDRTGPFTFNANDGAGTTGKVELVYGDADTHVLYGEGTYSGPMLKKKIFGRCVMLLKSGYSQDATGGVRVVNRLDVFVQFDHVGTELLAKTIFPLVSKSADYNFVEATRFLGRLSRESQRNGPGVGRMAEKLTKVDPQVRARFAQLSSVVGHQQAMRKAAAQSGTSRTAPQVVPSSAQTDPRDSLQANQPRRGAALRLQR